MLYWKIFFLKLPHVPLFVFVNFPLTLGHSAGHDSELCTPQPAWSSCLHHIVLWGDNAWIFPNLKGLLKRNKKKNLNLVPFLWSFKIKMCFLYSSRCQPVNNKMLNKRKETTSAILSIWFCVQFHPLYLCKTLLRSLMMDIEKYVSFRNLNR